MALAYAALANGGRVLKPRIVDRIQDHQGQVLKRFAVEEVQHIGGAPTTIERINEGLVRAVHHQKTGTALKAAPPRGTIAGKTGTAQVRKINRGRYRQSVKQFRHRDHAWFAGFAPAVNPKVVVVVFLEHGGSGGKQAAPVAGEIIKKYDSLIQPLFSKNTRASRTKKVGSRAR